MPSQKLTLVQWLDDLCVRFIINAPAEDLESVHRIFFQVEEAQWFYEDFVRPLDSRLPALSLQYFSRRIFSQCPIFAGYTLEQHDAALTHFMHFKQTVPVRGAIILNNLMDHVLLVKGWKGNNWSFPRGKIAKGESDLACAIREVYEETGYDLEGAGDVRGEDEDVPFAQHTLRDQDLKFFLFRGIPMDTHFAPRTRKEISKIEWHRLTDLPAYRENRQQYESDAQTAAVKSGKYYMVAPFLGRLKRWIREERKAMQSIPAVEIDGTQAVAEVLEAEQMISDENMAFATEDGAETEEISGSPQSDQATIMPVEITHSMIEERYPETPTGPTASTVTASAHEDGSRIRSPESEDRSADARMLMAVLRDQAETVKRKKGQTTQTQTLLDIFRSGSSAGGTIDGPVTTEEAQPVEVTEAEHPQAFEIPQPTTIKPPSSPPRHTEVLSTRSLTLLSILRSDPTPKELPAHEDFKVAALPEVAPKSLATNGSTTAQITSHKAGLTQHQSGLLSLFKDRGNFETPVELQVIESPSSQHLSSPSASSTATVRQTRSGHEARGKERDTVQSSFTSPTSSVAITNHPFAGLPLSTPQPEKKMSTATLVKKPLERTRDNSGIKSPSIVSSPRITVLSRPSDNGTGHRMSIRTPDAKAKPFEEVKGAELGLDGPSIKSRSDNPDDVSTAAPETTIPRRQNNNRPRSSRTPIVSSEKADELLSSFTRPKPSGQPRLFDPMLAQGYIQKYGPRRSQAGRNVSNSPRPSEGQPGARQASDALSTKPKVEKTEAPKAGRGDGKEMKKLMKRTSLVPEAPEQLPYKPTILRRPQMTT